MRSGGRKARNLGYWHGAPNRVTYWRCHSCQEQGLMYGAYTNGDNFRISCEYGCPDPEIETTLYVRELPKHSA